MAVNFIGHFPEVTLFHHDGCSGSSDIRFRVCMRDLFMLGVVAFSELKRDLSVDIDQSLFHRYFCSLVPCKEKFYNDMYDKVISIGNFKFK